MSPTPHRPCAIHVRQPTGFGNAQGRAPPHSDNWRGSQWDRPQVRPPQGPTFGVQFNLVQTLAPIPDSLTLSNLPSGRTPLGNWTPSLLPDPPATSQIYPMPSPTPGPFPLWSHTGVRSPNLQSLPHNIQSLSHAFWSKNFWSNNWLQAGPPPPFGVYSRPCKHSTHYKSPPSHQTPTGGSYPRRQHGFRRKSQTREFGSHPMPWDNGRCNRWTPRRSAALVSAFWCYLLASASGKHANYVPPTSTTPPNTRLPDPQRKR